MSLSPTVLLPCRLRPTPASVTARLLLPCALLTLAGCGVGTVVNGPAIGGMVAGLSGVVHGGQNPVGGAVVRLMAPNTTGYGLAPSVLASTTSSATGGNFTLPTYTCPVPDQLVYLEAIGGNSGAGANSVVDEVELLGKCSTLKPTTFVLVNELTTVAAAYALAPFASVTAAGTGIGTSSTNIVGLNNAFGPANNLIPVGSMRALGTNEVAGMVLPTQLLDTLGNILASCVNSTGPTSASCSTLFTDTTVGGVAPLNTFQAALNMALHPAANVVSLYGLATSNPPFQPAMTSSVAPPDFTLAIGYNGSGIATYGAIDVAIDAVGNAWISDFNTTPTAAGLIEITPSGQYPGGAYGFGTSVLAASVGIGVDPSGLIWVDNTNDGALTAFNPDGSVYTTVTGVNSPNGQAIDGSGNIYTSAGGNSNNTFAKASKVGSVYTEGPAITAYSHFGTGICISPSTVWVVSAGAPGESSTVTAYNPTNGTTTEINPDGGAAGLTGCSVDHAGNLYLPDFGGGFSGIEVYNSAGSLVTSFALPGRSSAGIRDFAQEIAIDGLGNTFVGTFVYNSSTPSTSFPGSLVEFNSAGTEVSPAYGYNPTTGSGSGASLVSVMPVVITGPGGVAVDGSGNVWLAGTNNGSGQPNFVTEVLGIAAPLVTPKSTAILNNQIGVRP